MAMLLSRRRHAGLIAGAIASIAALGLTGCSAGGYPDSNGQAEQSQSVADACAIVTDEVDSAVAGFQGASQDDPAVAVEAMRSASDALGQAANRVTNREVGALIPDLQDLFSQLGDATEDVLVNGDDSQAGTLQSLAGDFEGTLTEFQELCGPN